MKQPLKSYLIHGGLFLVTFVTTTMAGAEWTNGKSVFGDYSWDDFAGGLPYSICFLLILTCHEFGHYFTALYYRIKTTLPYYIPLPLFPFTFGTLGAIIRIKERVKTTQQNFDIGIAGPLAGFIVALGFLLYAFTHLPPPEYIFQFHPEYEQYGLDYASFVYAHDAMPNGSVDVVIGRNLLFVILEKLATDPARIPNVHEIIHYPFLFAGFLSLVFTSINLLPIGQLDGGHVLYGLVGYRWQRIIGSVFYVGFLFYAGLGYLHPSEPWDDLIYKIPLAIGFLFFSLEGLGFGRRDTLMFALGLFLVHYVVVMIFPKAIGYPGWLFFAFVIGRFVKIPHPPSDIEMALNRERKILGWLALLIFVLCFAPDPIAFDIIIKDVP